MSPDHATHLPARWAAGAARVCVTVAIVCAVAGAIEGVVFAVGLDPFRAGWGSRLISILSFVTAYLAAGLAAGALVGLPLTGASLLLNRSVAAAAAAACALVGGSYGWTWAAEIGDAGMAPGWMCWPVAAIAALLFAVPGHRIESRLEAPVRGAARLALAGVLLAAMAAWAISPLESSDAPPARAMASPPERPVSLQVAGAEARGPARNVILIVADTLRADHLSVHGYPRRTSPELESLAGVSATFEAAYVQATRTSPSVASIFTGAYPQTHGLVSCRTHLPTGTVTLAERLNALGFATHSIVANSNVGAAFGFHAGFDAVEEAWDLPGGGIAQQVTDRAAAWLARNRGETGGRPFFLYVHYIDAHAPYAAPEPWRDRFVDDVHYGRFAGVQVEAGRGAVGSIRPSVALPERPLDVDFYVARYDGEIAYLDHQIGRFLRVLDREGLVDDTLLIVTADHGEALSEHDVFFSHGGFAYEDHSRVPLIIRLPGRTEAGRRVTQPVELTGLTATVFEALGMEEPAGLQSGSLWRLAAGVAPDDDAAAFVEAGSVGDKMRGAVRSGRWKLIENPDGFDQLAGGFDWRTALSLNRKTSLLEWRLSGREFLARFELYDLKADPAESRNLALDEPAQLEELRARLGDWRGRGTGVRLEPDRVQDLPEAVLENLRSLGYVN